MTREQVLDSSLEWLVMLHKAKRKEDAFRTLRLMQSIQASQSSESAYIDAQERLIKET